MVDITFEEGNLRFAFQNIDHAVKYDEWRHYRKTYTKACGSSKAVDFIVVAGDETWLIEVKDYRRQRRKKEIDLWDEIALKVRDTMAGLVSAKFIGANDDEIKTAKLALGKRKLRVALHLEQSRNPSKLFPVAFNPASVEMKLRQNLKFADPHPKIFDQCLFPRRLGVVTSI